MNETIKEYLILLIDILVHLNVIYLSVSEWSSSYISVDQRNIKVISYIYSLGYAITIDIQRKGQKYQLCVDVRLMEQTRIESIFIALFW